MNEPIGDGTLALGFAAAAACLVSLGSILVLRPWLVRHALAQPNPRSSHRTPTPQGGGIAVVAATLAVVWIALVLWPDLAGMSDRQAWAITLGTIVLACVGFIDDIQTLPAIPRLLLQVIAVGVVVAALPGDLHVLPLVPWWLERIGMLVAGVWFVNLTNFMDGIDWMTVAEAVPISAAIVLIGLCSAVPALPALIAAALLGGILGFAPFNRPLAKLFLGDVGSLPIGLILGWLLLQVAASGHLAAAVLLPLYYLADATLTLLRRIVRREPLWQAHRGHFYQRAVDGGLSVPAVVARVLLVNVALAALALVSIAWPSLIVAGGTLLTGALAVAWLLAALARGTR
jgi:UDP-N-acetylmuramyl pentapeptide phosphotransferase/UDP-N-acetylglucosamine-1-phosphate transferase